MKCFNFSAAKEKKDALKKEMLPLAIARAEYRSLINEERHPRKYSSKAYTKKETAYRKILANSFTLCELAAATQNFSLGNLLGKGGFGRVYKGTISKTGQNVAVKQLDMNGSQGNKEFHMEVLVLSQLRHRNLVQLVGLCSDGKQRLLVYEYMPLGSLDYHLLDIPSDQKPLSWYTRMKIALDAALGLEYLHEKANPPIIYRDLKCSNILLDEQYNAKLSDFGLAKLGPIGDILTVSSKVMGTYGYCAPEYVRTGEVNTKSDVYSFGVVMLELISGQRAFDNTRPLEEQSLVTLAQPLFKYKQNYKDLVDPRLEGQYPEKCMHQAVRIAIVCIQEDPECRPLMMDVIMALSHLAVPPDEKTCISEKKKPVIPIVEQNKAAPQI